jgi:hypothetical protein
MPGGPRGVRRRTSLKIYSTVTYGDKVRLRHPHEVRLPVPTAARETNLCHHLPTKRHVLEDSRPTLDGGTLR